MAEPRLATLERAALQAHEARNYAAVIATAQRYFREGGAGPQVRGLVANAYYQTHDYGNAARELQRDVQAAEHAGRRPEQDKLLLLSKCYQQLNDTNALFWVSEKLVAYYPSREHWADLLARVRKRPDLMAHLALEVDRLSLLTGVLQSEADYLEMADRARQAHLPAEAKKVIDLGFERRALGVGPDALRHRRLREELARETIEDAKRIAQPAVEATAIASPDGIVLHRLGMSHVTHGEYAKGIAQMEAALRKGGLEGKPQDAKLRLAIAYLAGGQKARAIETFNTVGGIHGAADLSRLWSVYARNSSS